jgi:ADP-ribosylglycohydrolase
MFYALDPVQAIEQSAQSSRTTHGAATCLDACRYFGGLITGALQGVDKSLLLSPFYAPVPGQWQAQPLVTTEINEIAAGAYKERHPPDIQGSGYVVKSLEAALWAFYNSSDFREGCLLAANLGDDALRSTIEELARRLYRLSRR